LAFKIAYKKSVQRDLKRLSCDEVKRILDRIENDLSENPEANPSLKGRFAGLRKFRVGDYRVIYAILGNEVLVLRIGHRREV
jgi:mRNA interferase RelE/StbE